MLRRRPDSYGRELSRAGLVTTPSAYLLEAVFQRAESLVCEQLEAVRLSADPAGAPPLGQLIFRSSVDMAAIGTLRGKLADRSGDFLHRPADGDAEHALAAL